MTDPKHWYWWLWEWVYDIRGVDVYKLFLRMRKREDK